MATVDSTEPLKDGTRVRIINSGFPRGRIGEYLGPLGPQGARLYRVLVLRKPRPTYLEVREDQLEILPEP